MILFDPELHVYSDSETGEVVKSVTQWIDVQCPFYTSEGRERGRAVHELCQRYALGERVDNLGRMLDRLEYVNAFASFCRDYRPYAIHTECMISHTINGNRYAGTFDLLALINDKRVMIDLKTGARAKWHVIQNAAYSMASLESGETVNPDQCATLYLRGNGKYKYELYTGQEIADGIREFRERLNREKKDAG